MQVLIEKMLQQASLENQQELEGAESLNLMDIVKRAAASIAAKLEKKQQRLEISGPVQARVHGNSFLLEQALLNLLENAMDFGPRASVLHLQLERQNQVWCLRLRDQGPGIPDYARERVFDRYYSLPRTEGGAKSTGLGLTLVKQVMALHGGRAEIGNHPEGGAEARLFIRAL